MTEQPKYYLITSEELDMVRNQNHYWAERTLNTVLSRPAPSPSEQCNAESLRAIIEQNRAEAAAIRKDEREKTIASCIDAVESTTINDVEDARDAIESLRNGGKP